MRILKSRVDALVFGALVVLGLVLMAPLVGLSNPIATVLTDIFGTRIVLMLAPASIVVCAAIFTLERWIPAVDQEQFGPGFAQDAVYFFISQPFAWWVFAATAPATYRWADANASWIIFDQAKSWPIWLSGGIAFLIADFLFWARHYARHKIPLLWRFHEVHHSQTEYNLFTDRRVHLMDTLGSKLLGWVPLLVVGPDLRSYSVPVAVAGLIVGWYPIFYHANVRTNMGPLRYLIITPQTHRIHHSRELKHYDTNFGLYLSIWDRMFGTYSGDDGDYPQTGVAGSTLPMETSRHPIDLVKTYVAQFVHPFKRRSPALEEERKPEVFAEAH